MGSEGTKPNTALAQGLTGVLKGGAAWRIRTGLFSDEKLEALDFQGHVTQATSVVGNGGYPIVGPGKEGDKNPVGDQDGQGQLQYPWGAAWPLFSRLAKGSAAASDESIVW